MTDETVFLDEAGVTVTNARFIVGSETYAMRNITSVKTGKTAPEQKGPACLFLLGLVLAIVGFSSSSNAVGWLGIGFIMLCFVWAARKKPTFSVMLTTSAGEVSAYQSKSGDTVSRIVQALNDSIIHRG